MLYQQFTKTHLFKQFFKDFYFNGNSLTIFKRRGVQKWSKSLTVAGEEENSRKTNSNPGSVSRSVSSYISPSGASFNFDTHKLVLTLEQNGFTKQQAETLTTCLIEIVGSCVTSIGSNYGSKLDQERLQMKVQSSVDEIRNEMLILEKSKFSQIQEENLRLREKVTAMANHLEDEVSKLKSGVKLDMSLEKSQTREELAFRDQKIKDNGNKIETEIAKLGTQLEAQKLDLIKYLVGSLLSLSTVTLAIWRFLKT
ncbi:mitochondrial calcium uniporter regulator 1-like isoform X1 [Actinia tenebrosa]|uniref:Mitochondrial calcium uniporter regulator 1-like isoform X1 n=1 Tax=Actinia tenebrosa TaxID=6105 RepID=A0A6P8HNX1_ACTTE|nr:mitochondrial calcium uniporter regulator 1-like isoform X1 [Actinia tenebrosa]